VVVIRGSTNDDESVGSSDVAESRDAHTLLETEPSDIPLSNRGNILKNTKRGEKEKNSPAAGLQ